MKGLSKITKLLNDFVKTIDEELSIEEDSDFAYYPLSNKITYSLVVSEKNNADFMRSVEFFNPRVKCDIFLWSILHEIGHHETIDELSDTDLADSELIKFFVSNGCVSEELYYECPDERAATGWAVQYAESHAAILAKFWEELQKAIMRFYKLNHIC